MQLFVSQKPKPSPRWKEAFPDLLLSHRTDALPTLFYGTLWLDLSGLAPTKRDESVSQLAGYDYPLVVLSNLPSNDEALWALGLGAKGYAHNLAAPALLKEIELVVSHSGYWVPPALVQRLVRLTPVASKAQALDSDDKQIDTLTPRELMVAQQLMHGASNAEIAETLSITGRTVKAHVSSMFRKLGIKDRVHLALWLNLHTAQVRQ